MTRTKKTGLLVTLLVVLMALVAAAFTVPGIAKADVSLSANAKRFVSYMADYAHLDTLVEDEVNYKKALYEDYQPGEEGGYTAKSLWLNYAAAKSLVAGSLLSSQDIADIQESNPYEYARYEEMDKVYAKVYNYSLEYNTFLSEIVNPTELHPANYGDLDIIAKWQSGDYVTADNPPKDRTMDKNTELKMFMAIVDSDAQAKAALEARHQLLLQVNAEILKIEYYHTTHDGAELALRTGKDGGEVVLESFKTIDAVQTKIDDLKLGDLFEGDTKAIEKWNDYQDALETQKTLTEKYQKVQKQIQGVLDQVILTPQAEIYYTLKEAASVATTAYTNLLDESKDKKGNPNATDKDTIYNDYSQVITNYGKEGDELPTQKNLVSLNKAIDEVQKAIDQIKEAIKAFGDQKYDDTETGYVTKVKAAETAIKALPADVQKHEEDLYKTQPDSSDYFIEGYKTYKEALAYADAKLKEVSDIEDEIRELIAAFADPEGHDTTIAEVQGRVIDIESRMKALEDGQRTRLGLDKTEYPYGSGAQVSYSTVITTMKSTIIANYQLVNGTVEKIRNLYNDGKYTYSQRQSFKEIFDEYDKLDDNLKLYVENANLLTTMKGNYDAADAAVEEWEGAVAKVTKEDGSLDRITVTNMGLVKEAEDKWDALAKSVTIYFDDIQSCIETGVEGVDQTAKDAYTIYDQAKTARNNLNSLIQAFSSAVESISDDEIKVPSEVPDWVEEYVKLEKAHTEFLKANGTDEYLANDEYFSKAEAESTEAQIWTKYLKVVEFAKQYTVEDAIYDIYPEGKVGNDYEDVYQDHDFIVSDIKLVDAARKAYDQYIENGGVKSKIRNYDMLTFAETGVADLKQVFNAFVEKVLQVFDKDYKADLKEGTKYIDDAKLLEKIQSILDTKEYKGYGLNVAYLGGYAVSYPGDNDEYKVGTETETIETQLSALKLKYTGCETDIEVIKQCDALLEFAKGAWTTELSALNDEIQKYIQADKDGTLKAGDLKRIQEIVEIYDSLHSSQQSKINDWKNFQNVSDMQTAAKYFTNLVATLEANEEFTALTPYYIAVARSIYNSLDATHRTLYKPAYDRLDAYEVKYNAAKESGLAPSVSDLSDQLNTLDSQVQDLSDALDALGDTYATDAEVQDKIAQLKSDIQKDYDAAIKKAVDDAKTELQGKIDELKNGAVKTNSDDIDKLEQQLADLKTSTAADKKELEDKITKLQSDIEKAYKKAVDDAKTELQGKIDELKNGAVKTNSDDIDKLEQQLADLKTSTAADKKELEGKITKLQSDIEKAYTKAVEDAKTELQGKIDALKNGDVKANADDIDKLEKELADLKTSTGADKADLEAKIAALESKITAAYNQALENAKTELQGQIDTLKGDVDTLKGNVSALMVVLIIVGVIAVALVVCVILLFIKRKAD